MAADPPVTESPAGRGRGLVTVALLALFALRLGVLAGGADRGLEMGDEGYFLLNLNQPKAALPPQEIYRFLGALTGGAEIGVVAARLARIAVELAGSLLLIGGALAWATRRLFDAGRNDRLGFLALCLQGTLLSVGSRSLGYNDMTNLFVYAGIGSVFWLAATDEEQRARRAGFAALAGVLTALQLAAKFPPAALLAAIVLLVLAVGLRRLPCDERLRLLAAYLAAMAAACALIVVTTGGSAALLARLQVARQLPALTGYDPWELILRYLVLDQLTLANLAVFWISFGYAYLAGRRWAGATPDRAAAAALALACLALLFGVRRWQPNFLHPSLVYLAVLVVGLAAALVVLDRGRAARAGPGAADLRERAMLLGVLFVLPFAAIAGTNVPVTMRLPTHVLPLFVLIAVRLGELEPPSARALRRTFAGVAIAITSAVTWEHAWRAPYGLRTPLAEQRTPLRGLPGVKVDLASARFLELISDTLAEAGYRRGDPLIALDYMPGLVSYLGGTSPRYNLYMFGLPAYNCFNLNNARFASPPIVIVARPPSAEQVRCIESIPFPEGYELVRTLAFPYADAYVAFGAFDFDYVHVYRPRASEAGAGR